jgi:hypothetical protein
VELFCGLRTHCEFEIIFGGLNFGGFLRKKKYFKMLLKVLKKSNLQEDYI